MAFNKILVSVLLGAVAGQNTRTFPGFSLDSDISTTTPVPILRFIDQQNNDGSYTYGFQSGDGSYKIETRLVTGEVKGKYGYIDANGNLKETTYGAMADLGFVPVVDGIEYSVPSVEETDPVNNIIDDVASNNFNNNINNNNRNTVVASNSRFANFRAKNTNTNNVNNNAKIVNGRRAVLRKRLRVKAEDAIRPAEAAEARKLEQEQEQRSREEALRARELGLKARQEEEEEEEEQRAALRRLQNEQIVGGPVRSQSSRNFPLQQQRFFSAPQQPQTFQETPRSDPYVAGIDLNSGSYTVQY